MAETHHDGRKAPWRTGQHHGGAILQNGYIAVPADGLLDGMLLGSLNSDGRQEKHFYTSPSARYTVPPKSPSVTARESRNTRRPTPSSSPILTLTARISSHIYTGPLPMLYPRFRRLAIASLCHLKHSLSTVQLPLQLAIHRRLRHSHVANRRV